MPYIWLVMIRMYVFWAQFIAEALGVILAKFQIFPITSLKYAGSWSLKVKICQNRKLRRPFSHAISASMQLKYFKKSLFNAKFYNLSNAFLKMFLTYFFTEIAAFKDEHVFNTIFVGGPTINFDRYGINISSSFWNN